MPAGVAPGVSRASDLGCVLDAGLAERTERAVDGADRTQCSRRPHHVDVERETATGVAHPAIAPAARMTIAIRVAFEADEIPRDGLARVRRRLPRDIREIRAQRRSPPLHERAFP